MPTLFLLCGLPGVGKTTLAKRLEQAHYALRLTPDEWITALLKHPADSEELERLRDPVEALQWDVAERALSLGVSVILDWGFWSRAERDAYRTRAGALGARVEIHALTIERDELLARLARRNAYLPPGAFAVTEAQLNEWWELYEPPTAEELTPD
jgi:predicted kinase